MVIAMLPALAVFDTGFDEIWYAIAMALGTIVGVGGGAVGAYYLLRAVLESNYRSSYQATLRHLQQSELPLLVADENFLRSILENVREQVKFLFSGPPPLSGKLEEQLGLAACYIQALRMCQYAASDKRTPTLRHGDGGYWVNTPTARTFNILASLSCCLGSAGCIAIFFLPFMLLRLQRQAEQRGTLAALCDFFADVPGHSLPGPPWPPKNLLNKRP
jgi:hypothetical protein